MRPLLLFLLLFLPSSSFSSSLLLLFDIFHARIESPPSRDKRSRSGKMRERRTTLAITIPYARYIYIYFSFFIPRIRRLSFSFSAFSTVLRLRDSAATYVSLSTDRFSTERSRGEHRLGQITVPLYVNPRAIYLFVYLLIFFFLHTYLTYSSA